MNTSVGSMIIILLTRSIHQFRILTIFKISLIFLLQLWWIWGRHDYNLVHQIQPPIPNFYDFYIFLQLWWIWGRHGFQQKCQGIWSWYFIWRFLFQPRWLCCFWCQFANANYWPNVCSCFCLQVSEKFVKWLNPRTAHCDFTEK